jgi:hypothetical protein
VNAASLALLLFGGARKLREQKRLYERAPSNEREREMSDAFCALNQKTRLLVVAASRRVSENVMRNISHKTHTQLIDKRQKRFQPLCLQEIIFTKFSWRSHSHFFVRAGS